MSSLRTATRSRAADVRERRLLGLDGHRKPRARGRRRQGAARACAGRCIRSLHGDKTELGCDECCGNAGETLLITRNTVLCAAGLAINARRNPVDKAVVDGNVFAHSSRGDPIGRNGAPAVSATNRHSDRRAAEQTTSSASTRSPRAANSASRGARAAEAGLRQPPAGAGVWPGSWHIRRRSGISRESRRSSIGNGARVPPWTSRCPAATVESNRAEQRAAIAPRDRGQLPMDGGNSLRARRKRTKGCPIFPSCPLRRTHRWTRNAWCRRSTYRNRSTIAFSIQHYR